MLSARPSWTRVPLPRRCIHTPTDDTREHLRQLLRETAQSVVVVTARALRHPPSTSTSTSSASTYHGATLSSFTSIALDPLPLVAFSLRVPSRMASALNAHVNAHVVAPVASPPPPAVHLIINILSAAQPHLADLFARPDLHPHPFQDPGMSYTLSRDDLPILAGTLGALSCRLVGSSLPLAHLHASRAFDEGEDDEQHMGEGGGEVQQVSGQTGLASELFIARVLRVERVPLLEDNERDRIGLHKLPLLYHRRRYTTVGDHTKS